MANETMTGGIVGAITVEDDNGTIKTTVKVTGDVPNPAPPPATLEIMRTYLVTEPEYLTVFTSAKAAGGTVEVTSDDQDSTNTVLKLVWT